MTSQVLVAEREEELDRNEAERLLLETLGEKYRSLAHVCTGGTRHVFRADWGKTGEEQRAIKIDREYPKNERAKKHVGRGCDSGAELEHLEGKRIRGATELVDYFETGERGVVTVERWFEAPSLEEIVRGEGPLDFNTFRDVFSQVISTEDNLISKHGLLHRDAKPSNILVKREGGIEVRLTDWANTCFVGETEEKFSPTAGGHLVTDPLLMSEFTKEDSEYGEQSEIYTVASDMLYAIRGQPVVEYSPEEGIAREIDTGESLLDLEGRIDGEKHEEAIEGALGELPRRFNRLKRVFRRGLTLDREERYDSFREFREDFENLKKGRLETAGETLRENGALMAFVAATGLIGLLGSAYRFVSVREENKALQKQVEQAARYDVGGRWNGNSLEVANNLVESSLDVSVKGGDVGRYEEEVVRAEPGDELGYTFNVDNLALPESKNTSLRGRVYLEGYAGDEFGISPAIFDKSKMERFMATVGYKWGDIELPEDIGEGVHYIVGEVYPPKGEDKNIDFKNPGRAISRVRVPVVVGDVDGPAVVTSLKAGVSPFVSFNNVGDNTAHINKNNTYEIAVPGLGHVETYEGKDGMASNSFSKSFHIPRVEGSRQEGELEQQVLRLTVRRREDIVSETYFPIEKVYLEDGQAAGWWEVCAPNYNFPRRVRNLKELED